MTFGGKPDADRKRLERLTRATTVDVKNVAKRWLDADADRESPEVSGE